MLLTYTYVRGEEQMLKLCNKMRLDKPIFCESFAHCGNVTIERLYANPGDGFHAYFIFTMPHENGMYHQSDVSKLVYQLVREGEKNMKKV